MRQPLVLAVAQPTVEPHDLAANAHHHAEMVARARARVVVFPEASLTGYHFDADPVDPDDGRLAPLIEACVDTGTLALAGAPVAAHGPDGAHLAVLAFDETTPHIGGRVAYRKMWLGSAEVAHFVPGERPGLVEVDGWRIGLAVCRDTGVAEHAATTAALGIDVYAAGVLEHHRDHAVLAWRAARVAADHGVWVAMASFAGATGEGYDQAAGRSALWRPDGSVAAAAGTHAGELARAEIGSG